MEHEDTCQMRAIFMLAKHKNGNGEKAEWQWMGKGFFFFQSTQYKNETDYLVQDEQIRLSKHR